MKLVPKNQVLIYHEIKLSLMICRQNLEVLRNCLNLREVTIPMIIVKTCCLIHLNLSPLTTSMMPWKGWSTTRTPLIGNKTLNITKFTRPLSKITAKQISLLTSTHLVNSQPSPALWIKKGLAKRTQGILHHFDDIYWHRHFYLIWLYYVIKQ